MTVVAVRGTVLAFATARIVVGADSGPENAESGRTALRAHAESMKEA